MKIDKIIAKTNYFPNAQTLEIDAVDTTFRKDGTTTAIEWDGNTLIFDEENTEKLINVLIYSRFGGQKLSQYWDIINQ